MCQISSHSPRPAERLKASAQELFVANKQLIFLSHIHEEKELALMIQEALKDEFGGFVDVFVSSDGTSIPAGSNFLDKIEEGLVTCGGALYLISPKSVSRNWINFELGAVWVRSASSKRAGGPEIPALPVCHSGMSVGQMPAPLNNLSGIMANDAPSLERGFHALQKAVGGSGKLRTDFDALATRIRDFERRYTVGNNVVKAMKLITSWPAEVAQVIALCEQSAATLQMVEINVNFVESSNVAALQQLALGDLSGLMSIHIMENTTTAGAAGNQNGAKVRVKVSPNEVLKVKDQLR